MTTCQLLEDRYNASGQEGWEEASSVPFLFEENCTRTWAGQQSVEENRPLLDLDSVSSVSLKL